MEFPSNYEQTLQFCWANEKRAQHENNQFSSKPANKSELITWSSTSKLICWKEYKWEVLNICNIYALS